MNNRVIRGVRWALFVPAAIVATVTVGFCIGRPVSRVIDGGVSDAQTFMLLAFVGVLQGVAFVFGGAAIAPPGRHRDMAWLLATALCIGSGLLVFGDIERGTLRISIDIIPAISSLGTALYFHSRSKAKLRGPTGINA
jgi:hypothetical protein